MKDRGFTDQIKGKVKKTFGDLTDNEKMQAEGILNQTIGKTKEMAADIQDAAEEVIEKAKEKFHKEG